MFPNTTTPTTTNNTNQPNNNFSLFNHDFRVPYLFGSSLPHTVNNNLPNTSINNMGYTINPRMNNNTTTASNNVNVFRFFPDRFIDGPNNNDNNANNTYNNGYTVNNNIPSQLEDTFLNYFDELIGRVTNPTPMGLNENEVNNVCILSRFCNNNDNQSITCSICVAPYEENEEINTLRSCNHNFHKTCLTHWLQNHDTCPLCRANVREYQTNTNTGTNTDTNTGTNTNTNTGTNTDTNTGTNYTSINIESNNVDALD